MIGHMRLMGNSGRIAIGAFLAAVALLILTAVTLHEAVLMCFVAAAATAYVACVAEVVIRRRHKTLAASGIGTVLFIAFGVAFLRQWGLAFNPDPAALTAPVTTAHPDLYFYLAAAAGAATLLLLFAGTVVPGRRGTANASASRRPASATARPASASGRPASATSRPAPGARMGTGGSAARTAVGSAARSTGSRTAPPRTTPRAAATAAAPKSPRAKPPAPAPSRTSTRR
jgi:hypothetical protein